MDASSGTQRDIALETIKSDLVALQSALTHIRRQSANVIERQIFDRPFRSVAAAFAIGFIASRLLAHRLF
jgi:ElaB/YqjD/DUF883 family membrane-anchored ribosome-binding protein